MLAFSLSQVMGESHDWNIKDEMDADFVKFLMYL